MAWVISVSYSTVYTGGTHVIRLVCLSLVNLSSNTGVWGQVLFLSQESTRMEGILPFFPTGASWKTHSSILGFQYYFYPLSIFLAEKEELYISWVLFLIRANFHKKFPEVTSQEMPSPLKVFSYLGISIGFGQHQQLFVKYKPQEHNR